jgi:hypothetical protein
MREMFLRVNLLEDVVVFSCSDGALLTHT